MDSVNSGDGFHKKIRECADPVKKGYTDRKPVNQGGISVKRRRGWKKILTGRLTAVSILLGFQLAVILTAVIKFAKLYPLYRILSLMIGAALILHIVRNISSMAYRLTWIVLILVFPLFGAAVYLIFCGNRLSWDEGQRMRRAKEAHRVSAENNSCQDRSARYILAETGYPVCSNRGCEYYSSGEAYYQSLLQELEKADKYIYLEYFILSSGAMWDGIHRILREKSACGVDVRIIYDDLGSMGLLPRHFITELKREGIRCAAFHRFIPVLSAMQNHRDHRKICVIDGHTAFTGGINIGDEYINRVKPFGHWKDSGIMIRGEGAACFSAMFLTMWDYITGEITDVLTDSTNTPLRSGTVQPYCSGPQEENPAAENVYLDLFAAAEKSLWIMTPYLIIDEVTERSLIRAARSGVDVRIITPGIPDKKLVFEATRAHYPGLLRGGVRIWEYTPGFLHAKAVLADEKTAAVGSVNLDYRSFFLHFECGVRVTDEKTAREIRRDFLRTFEASREIREGKTGFLRSVFRGVLELLSPLL